MANPRVLGSLALLTVGCATVPIRPSEVPAPPAAVVTAFPDPPRPAPPPAPPPPAAVTQDAVLSLLARYPTGGAAMDRALIGAYADGHALFDAAAAAAILAAVQGLSAHGIEAVGYQESRLAESGVPPDERDVLLTRAVLLLARDLAPRMPETALPKLIEDVTHEPGKTLAALAPQDPQYAGLLAAYARYQGLEWPRLEIPKKVKLQEGTVNDAVRVLRQRLRAEGWPAGDPQAVGGDLFDGGLMEVLGRWQESRQIKATGKVDGDTLAALRISPAALVDSIRLSLDHWRHSRTRLQTTYVRVNVPAFEAYLYVDGKLDRTHRVVVGAPGAKNHTPLIQATMRQVVLNPIWHVPDRIKSEELDKELEKNPNWYQDHGFKLVQKDGKEIAEQGPGRGNALGRVKFLFPNPYDVYMHDTPKRAVFDRTMRAASHGCVRVHNPVDLLERILELDDHPRRAEVPSILQTYQHVRLDLQRPIPVIIEYETVSIGTAGEVRFHRDVYGYDKRRMKAPKKAPRAKAITARVGAEPQ